MKKEVKTSIVAIALLLLLPTSYGLYLLVSGGTPATVTEKGSLELTDSDALNNTLTDSKVQNQKEVSESFITSKVNTEDTARIDEFNSGYKLVNLSNEQLEVQKLRDQKLKEQRKVWKLDTPLVSLSFNKRYTSDFVSINTTLYQIVQKYFCSSTFADTKYSQYVDPLYIMAVSNVEFGGETSPNILLAPAVPTSKGVKVTKSNILTFGYSDYMQYPKVLSSDRDEYRGPLQMYVTGLTEAIKPSELLSCEWVQLQNLEDCDAKSAELASPQYIEGSGTIAHVDGMTLANKAGAYGDRWNYADCVNRLSGSIYNNWRRYEKLDCTKDGIYAIDSKCAWMAMTAIGHNASPGIYYMKDNVDIGNSYYWWPFGPYKQAREYAHYLGTDECSSYIASKADEALQKYAEGGSLHFRLSRQEGVEIAEELVEKGSIPSNLWRNTCWNHEEKIGYPIQVIYNYFILKGIYSGK